METPDHLELKAMALRWLAADGCAVAACEVRCPISRYRVDAAGYADPPPPQRPAAFRAAVPGGPAPRLGRTTFVECKVSRADFLRDTRDRPRLLAERDRLHRELEHVRAEFIRPLEPHLRRGDGFLFPEMESWAYEQSASHAARVIVRELRRIDQALYQETKFFMLAQYRLAGRLLLLTPPGLIEPGELPRKWGWLVGDPAGLERGDTPGVRMAAPPIELDAPPGRVLRVLRNIAVAAAGPSGVAMRRGSAFTAPLPTPVA